VFNIVAARRRQLLILLSYYFVVLWRMNCDAKIREGRGFQIMSYINLGLQ